MNFEQSYNSDQLAFRQVVRGWLEQRVPRGLDLPYDGSPIAPETQERVKQFRRQVGANGWLAPTWPKEYGGGGLSPALAAVIQDEMLRLELPSMGDNYRWVPAVMEWGTEEQKRGYVIPSLRGETITWQAFSEAQAGSDLASVKTRAVPDGSNYRISGEKAFITGRFDPDYLWTLALTDPERPPRYNLGLFMIDARSPGITIKTQRLLAGSERTILLDQVPVPAGCLVGTLYQGWEIVQAILEGERGGPSFHITDDETMEEVLQYLREDLERS